MPRVQQYPEETPIAALERRVAILEGIDPHTGVSADDHHNENHAARHASAGADSVSHDVIAGVSVDDHHNEDHAARHASGGGDALSHDAIAGVSVDDHHDQAHTVASHSDTGATGSELNTLTDGSDADVLHDHDDGTKQVVTDATVDNGDVTLSTSFVDAASLTFTMPTGWNTAHIVAWGTGYLTVAGTITGQFEIRMKIGSSNGTAANSPGGGVTAPQSGGLAAVNDVVVSGNTGLDVQVRKTVSGDSAVTRTHTLTYIAIRAS